MEESFLGNFYRFMEWVTRFVYVNILWIIFSLLGLVILGFFPATIAMFTVVRKWILSESDTPIFKTFWKTYKKEFLKSNSLGYIFSLIGVIFYLDVIVAKDASGLLYYVLFLLMPLVMVYTLTLLYIIPVYVHFESKLLGVIKNAVLIVILHPIMSISMAISVFLFFLVLYFFPVFIPICGGSISAFIMMWYCNLTFNKVEKQKNLTTTDET